MCVCVCVCVAELTNTRIAFQITNGIFRRMFQTGFRSLLLSEPDISRSNLFYKLRQTSNFVSQMILDFTAVPLCMLLFMQKRYKRTNDCRESEIRETNLMA